nr:TetR/AcrR family transcriptional regulator [Sphingobium sp. OAS761]
MGSRRVRHLLDVARGHFVDRGFDPVSIDAIARAAGVSKETIYRHFPDKEALFRAALDAAGEEFTARALAVHDRAPTASVELAGLARAIADSAYDQGLFSTLWVAVGVAHRMPDLATSLRDGQWQRLEPVREALEHFARDHGVSRPVALELALDFGSLAVEGPALLMGFPAPAAPERTVRANRVAALFAQGVAAGLRSGGATVAGTRAVGGSAEGMAPHLRTLLEVSTNHFLESGFEGANLDAIGVDARVGRGTLYRHFGSKAGLFAAAMRFSARACIEEIVPPPLPGHLDRAALTIFVETALDNLVSVRSIGLHRAVVAQSRRDPALARDVFAILRAPWLSSLGPWLAALGLQDDPDWHARQLLVLATRGNRLFAGAQPLGVTERHACAARAVTILLDGFIAVT